MASSSSSLNSQQPIESNVDEVGGYGPLAIVPFTGFADMVDHVIEAEPINFVPHGGSFPLSYKRRVYKRRKNPYEKPPGLPEDWTMDVKIRKNGATAGLPDKVVESHFMCCLIYFTLD